MVQILIEPVGIETKFSILGYASIRILIEPVGIETFA